MSKKREVKAPAKNSKPKVAKKRSRLKYKNILIFSAVVILLSFCVISAFRMPIRNIIVQGNYFLSDQEIIDIAGIRYYPSTLRNSSRRIKRNIEEHTFVKSVSVRKRGFFSRVIIKVEENLPVFFYLPENSTVLANGALVSDRFAVPTLINKVPDTVYERLIERMAAVPNEVLIRMSEIRYMPNEVDVELFLITMTDGNYVYININRFDRIHGYIDIVKSLDNRRGILHLDSGGHFEVLVGN